MTVTDQIKILDKKIMQNKTQYDLDRKLRKYLHCLLITEDLDLKPSMLNKLNLSILH